jgi:hypothetical protein
MARQPCGWSAGYVELDDLQQAPQGFQLRRPEQIALNSSGGPAQGRRPDAGANRVAKSPPRRLPPGDFLARYFKEAVLVFLPNGLKHSGWASYIPESTPYQLG